MSDRISYATACREAAAWIPTDPAFRRDNGESWPPIAAALRALAELVKQGEKAQADLAANVSTQGDAHYEYEMTCHALVSDLAAGFTPEAAK